jgi:cytidine deaminase
LSIDLESVMRAALAARDGAYAPYSDFAVGAAVLCEGEAIVSGCNIENASYGLAMCAERVALYAAYASGKRVFSALCVAGPPDRLLTPCGACRQVMNEFNVRMLVGCAGSAGICSMRLEELLPFAFGRDELA